jgi:beta-lactam-binding protein with PASTA domain
MGEIKTSKVKALKSFNEQDKFQNWKHFVEFENGDGGFCSTKDPEGSNYAVGKEVEYEYEKREKKDKSGTYHIVKKVKQQNSPYGFQAPVQAKGRDAKDYKCEAVMNAASNAANTIAVKEGISEKDFPAYFKAYLNPMLAEIDKIYAQ